MVNWAWMLKVKRKVQSAELHTRAIADPLPTSHPRQDATVSPFLQMLFAVLFPGSGTRHPFITVYVNLSFLKPFPQRQVGLGMHSIDVWGWEAF